MVTITLNLLRILKKLLQYPGFNLTFQKWIVKIFCSRLSETDLNSFFYLFVLLKNIIFASCIRRLLYKKNVSKNSEKTHLKIFSFQLCGILHRHKKDNVSINTLQIIRLPASTMWFTLRGILLIKCSTLRKRSFHSHQISQILARQLSLQ